MKGDVGPSGQKGERGDEGLKKRWKQCVWDLDTSGDEKDNGKIHVSSHTCSCMSVPFYTKIFLMTASFNPYCQEVRMRCMVYLSSRQAQKSSKFNPVPAIPPHLYSCFA